MYSVLRRKGGKETKKGGDKHALETQTWNTEISVILDWEVRIFDNAYASKPGGIQGIDWVKRQHGGRNHW